MRKKLSIILLGLSTLALGAEGISDEETRVDPVTGTSQSTSTGVDPVEFITRWELTHEYNNPAGIDNDYQGATVFRGDLAIGERSSMRLDLPMINTHGPSGDDIELGHAVTQYIRLVGNTRSFDSGWDFVNALGIRADWHTATGDVRDNGQDGVILAPLYCAAFTKDEWLIAPVFQWYLGDEKGYYHEGEYIDSRDRLSLKAIISYQPVQKNFHAPISWITLEPEIFIDFEKDEEWAELGVEFGKMMSPTTAVFIKPTFDMGGTHRNTNFKLKVGFKTLLPHIVAGM